MTLHEKDPAPDFSLTDQNGVQHSLQDYKGRWVLLYFYPKDDTPGCTTEACTFQENLPDFTALQIQILGVSADSSSSHQSFSQKFHLSFPLLADPEKKVIREYDVWQQKSMFGKKYMGIARTSFLIDPNGVIAKIYEKVQPKKHASVVLKDLKNLMSSTK